MTNALNGIDVIDIMVDAVDRLILSALSQDARQSSFELWDYLRGHGRNISSEEIESRIKTLEENGTIKGYTISVDSRKIPGRVIHIDLVQFRSSQALPKRLKGFKKYHSQAPFVVFSGKTLGGYDWITVKSFLNKEMAYEEHDIYRNLFGDILQIYEVYDFVPQTEASLYALTYTETEYKKFMHEWMPPFLGQ